MKNPVHEMNLEQMIKKSWQDKDYIRCKNLVNFANKYYPGNEIFQKYKKKVSKINITKEYIKYIRNFNDDGTVLILLEIMNIIISYIIFVDYFGIEDFGEDFEYVFIFYFIAILLLIRLFIIPIYKFIDGKIIIASLASSSEKIDKSIEK
ncbi:hypothetical protein [Candidatus Vampirococcus lugosii]|uniref:Uncharacterized protein n=1 Tax=Candidatus Vampirococcus lugosii TaxID=2789015 RepID=A0ABS5QLC2_9BACT|nr:hypothetical protein [Candidatus Vampirococcus lugosii]MBS8122000.1 hypothetical protein [Candidatus Vampirococcus lugosii]